MNLAIIFLFHANPDICANRLEILRRFNPDTPIYGLFGGEAEEEAKHRAALQGYLDDFYAFPDDRPTEWKWRNADQMIAEWYRARGKNLPWDTVVLVEWDMIVAGNLRTIYGSVKQDEIVVPGLRPLREVEHWWYQVNRRRPERRSEYLGLLDHVRREHGYDSEPLCGYTFGSCLPRTFLEKYATIASPDLGYLEYKVPMYAQIFGTPFCTAHSVPVWWDKPIFAWHPRRRWNPFPPFWMIPPAERALNAAKREIPVAEIQRQLRLPNGARLFHPVYGIVPPEELSKGRSGSTRIGLNGSPIQ